MKKIFHKRKAIFSLFLAFVLMVTGIPFFPGSGIPTAHADTSLTLPSTSINTVYGGTADIKWSYNDPGVGQTEHATNIGIKNGEQFITKVKYPVTILNTYPWNGKINGEKAHDGSYIISVIPTNYEEHGAEGEVKVDNPNPPAPAALKISPVMIDEEKKIPDLKSDEQVISGVAEIGTKVTLHVSFKVKAPNSTPVADQSLEDLVKNPPVSDIVEEKDPAWTTNIPKPVDIDHYFQNFPVSSTNKPAHYLGEWKIKVKLPAYKIATITATATREFDGKSSQPSSEILQVLRYKSETTDVKWPHLSGYYYGHEEAGLLLTGIKKIAEYNSVPINKCIDMQSCQGPIYVGNNLLIPDPIQAGKIENLDIKYINEAYAHKYGHPLARDLDPVNLATGDFSFHQTNMSLQAAMPLNFTATYHGRDVYNGMLGVGWHHSLDWHIDEQESGEMVVVSPDGASVVYMPTSNGQYYTPPGVFNVLTKKMDGSFELAMPDKSVYTFREDGLIYSMRDTNQNLTSFTYIGDVLQTVRTPGASMTFTYGPGGKLAKLTDQSGRNVQYHYNTETDDLKEMILPDGAVINYAYDEHHWMTEIQNPNQTSTLINEFDSEGRVIRQKDFSGEWGSIQYNQANKMTTVTDALGNTKNYTYDDRQRQTGISYMDGTSEEFTYNNNDKMTQMIDRNGNATRYVYDAMGNLLQSIDQLGAITNITYNAFNKPLEVTDPLGHKTTLAYDGRGNMTAITDALGHTSTITVDDLGIPTSMVNAAGEKVTLTNDTLGFAQTITSPAAGSETLTRDPLHRVTQVIDALQQTNHIEYDPRDRVTARIDALNQRETFTYDKNSNLTSYTDVSGATTAYGYDSFNRVVSVTDSLQHTTGFTYDAVGNRTKVIDAKGAAVEYSYNNVNRIVQVKNAQGAIKKLTYDGNGNVLTSEDPRGGKTVVTYNKRNQPMTVTNAAGATSIYTYDAVGKLIVESNALGQTTTYDYDDLGQLTKTTDALQQETLYQYDNAGRMTQVTMPNGGVLRTEYDARGLVSATIDPLGNRKEVTHDALGRVSVAKDELHTPTTYNYDPLGRVQSIINVQGSTTSFAYDPLGHLKQITDANQHVTKYSYDPLGRLSNVINALNKQTSYTYDEVGNLTAKTDANENTTQYTYNVLHQLTKETDPLGKITQMLYDTVGNVSSMQNPDGKSTGYTYDPMNRLSTIAYADGKSVNYSYDLLGRRTAMVDALGTTSYQYDALNRLSQVTDANHQTIRYEWTATGQRKKMVYPDQSSVSYDVDLMDRITGVTDASGGHTSYSYDARGLLTAKKLPNQTISAYQYDNLGQLTQLEATSRGGKVSEQLTYAYDLVGNRTRMSRMEEGDDEDNTDGIEHPANAIVTQYAYDALNQLVDVQKQNGSDAQSLIKTSYSYDAVGNRLTKGMIYGDLASTEQYTYNVSDQLTHWQNGVNYKDYTYDLRGNQTKVMGTSDAESEGNVENSITNSVYGTTITNAVYGTTAPTTNSTPSTPEVLAQFTWNAANRLTRQVNEKGDLTQYSYDGDGNRMSMIVDLAYGPNGKQGNTGNGNSNNGNGNSNNGNGNGNSASKCNQVVPGGFVPPGLAKKCGQVDNPDDYPPDNPGGPRDGWEHQYKKKHQEIHYTNDVSVALPEPIQATGEDATKWKETYTYGAVGDRISMTYLPANDPNNGWAPSLAVSGAQPGTAPKTLYYLSDALGSTLDMQTQDGRIASRYHYDEFGVPTDAKKFDTNWSGPDNLFGYTGLGYDYSSDLTYARARYYQPEIGRFISEDTYKGTLGNPQSQNGYAYVENNPINWIDPSGFAKLKSGFYDSFGAKLSNITDDPIEAAENLKFAKTNWMYAQENIDLINSGKSTGTYYEQKEYWVAYQKSMHDYAVAQRDWIGTKNNKINIYPYIKLAGDAAFIVGGGGELKYDGEYLTLKIKGGANGQIGAAGGLTAGIEVNNGNLTKGLTAGGKLGEIGMVEANVKLDGELWEFSVGGGAGVGLEVQLLPVVSAGTEGEFTILKFHLPISKNSDSYIGAPTFEEWMNQLNGKGWDGKS